MSESHFSLLQQGLVIGWAVSAPIGPTSIFCLQRAITKGMIAGFVSCTGAATAQAVQAAIGILGLKLISSSIADHKGWFNLVSGVFLCYLGVKIFLSHFSIKDTEINFLLKGSGGKNEFLNNYVAALLLTSINPISILPFIAFFTQMSPAEQYSRSIWMGIFVLGVFISSTFWYGLISVVIHLFSRKILLRWSRCINRIAGTAIAIFGCASIFSAWSNYFSII